MRGRFVYGRLTHIVMRQRRVTEAKLVVTFWVAEALWCGLLLGGFVATRSGGSVG